MPLCHCAIASVIVSALHRVLGIGCQGVAWLLLLAVLSGRAWKGSNVEWDHLFCHTVVEFAISWAKHSKINSLLVCVCVCDFLFFRSMRQTSGVGGGVDGGEWCTFAVLGV